MQTLLSDKLYEKVCNGRDSEIIVVRIISNIFMIALYPVWLLSTLIEIIIIIGYLIMTQDEE